MEPEKTRDLRELVTQFAPGAEQVDIYNVRTGENYLIIDNLAQKLILVPNVGLVRHLDDSTRLTSTQAYSVMAKPPKHDGQYFQKHGLKVKIPARGTSVYRVPELDIRSEINSPRYQ